MTMDLDRLDELADLEVERRRRVSPPPAAIHQRAGRRRRHRRFVPCAAIGVLLLGAGVLAWSAGHDDADDVVTVANDDGDRAPTPPPEQAPAITETATDLGPFVWPAPPRDFATADELAMAFIQEVVQADQWTVAGAALGVANQPASVTLSNGTTDVDAFAVPSSQGWGFVQIDGSNMAVEVDPPRLTFRGDPNAASYDIEVRLADGRLVRQSGTATDLRLPPDMQPGGVLSALVLHLDADGVVIDVSGGQFDDRDIEPPAPTSTSVPTEDSAPSQSAADAARYGIVPALAALPTEIRVAQVAEAFGTTRIESPEGTWLLSQLSLDGIPSRDGCRLGDPGGTEGIDVVDLCEYAEILLLDPESGEVLRAYPFPGFPPQQILLTDDAVYCMRQGDGGLPNSILCRIDRTSQTSIVRVFPSSIDSGVSPDRYLPPNWVVDQPATAPLWQHFEVDGAEISVIGSGGRLRLETEAGTVLGQFLWSDAINALPGSPSPYDAVVSNDVPPGLVVVLATVTIGNGAGHVDRPDVTGPLACRLVVDVPPGGTVDVEIAYDGGPDCLRLG